MPCEENSLRWPPPKIVSKQRIVRTGGKVITSAERRMRAAGVDIAVEDE